MSKRASLSRFSKKYSWFLSDASNEEIVSISKELSGEMSGQVKILNFTALFLLAISSVILSVSIFIVSFVEGPVTRFDSAILFMRIGSIALFCISSAFAVSSVSKVLQASAMSPLMWRNIRETADDEKVYESIQVIKKLNKALFTGRNSIKISSLLIVAGMAVFAATYCLEMLSVAGYL